MGSLPSGYYYQPLGQVDRIMPHTNESVDACYKRLRRLARHYVSHPHVLHRRAFRVQIDGDAVLWAHVPVGEHVKLAPWHGLRVGETVVLKDVAGPADLKAAKATVRYLKRAGKGSFQVQLVDGALTTTRTEAAWAAASENSGGDA